MIREIYANEAAGEVGQGAQYCFDAFCLQDRIAGVAADDDARVWWYPAMQADEVQSVEGQDRALFNGRGGEDLFIGQASPGEAEHCGSEDVVPERTHAHRDVVIEVFVGEKERHQKEKKGAI